MRALPLAAALLAQVCLVGCGGPDDTRSSVNDLGSSISGGFRQSNDTYGTQRRMDVYGAATAPSLPTIGAAGYGK